MAPVVELTREESVQLQLHLEKYFTLLDRKKLNLRINYNSRVKIKARQRDYKSYGIVDDTPFGRQETISWLCYQHRFSNRPESLVLLEDCRQERKMLFLGKIHRNLG